VNDSLESVLGGEWCFHGDGRCFIVERRIPPGCIHGRTTVGDIADRLRRDFDHAPLLTTTGRPRQPLAFFDLETTGLSGGAGACVFLVGFGRFTEDGSFATRQYLLAGAGDERAMLERVGVELQRAGTLVSFNGKAFDAPMLETRYLFQRIDWPGGIVPHLDVVHPARRFWGQSKTDRSERQVYGSSRFVPAQDACSLLGLERRILGAARRDDVSGFEIPSCYFRFVRSCEAGALVGVLEHNRLDLLSLAALTARLFRLVAGGADEASDGREALALGKVYARAGDMARARAAFEKALSRGGVLIVAEASRALAVVERRAREHERAATHWRRVLDCPGCPTHLLREASEALAIHHEHRARDFEAARAFALRTVDEGSTGSRMAAACHRLARIERKLRRVRPLLA
jgi:uncharacterized protein YprB with RNaseH-like and TPR domain